jgi:lysine-N-methylase
LSDTCRHYPRLFTRNQQTIGTYASLSCPEAARLALLDPQALDAATMELDFPNASRIPFRVQRNAPLPGQSDPVQLQADLIREGLNAIIRFTGHSASQALLVCGIVVRRIAEQVRSAPDPEAAALAVPQTLARFMDEATLLQARRLSEELKTPQDSRIALLQKLTALYVGTFPARPSFRAQLDDAMQGLGEDQSDLAGMQARYAAAEQEWFAPFDAANPHILKNYLLNDLAKGLFPVGTVADIESELMHLSVRFALIKMYLVGQSGKYREAFGEANCVRTIYTFVRNIEHNPKFLPAVMGLLAEQGFANLATLATLVK